MRKKGFLVICFMLIVMALSGCSKNESMDYYPTDKGDYAGSGSDYSTEDTNPLPPEQVVDPGEDAGGDIVQDSDIPALLNRKIIYVANLTMDAVEPDTVYNSVLSNLDTYSAYIESSNITATRYIVKIRVLSEFYTDFIEAIKTTGDVVSFSNTSQDITNSYSTFAARKLALETQQARILELIAVADNLEDIIILEDARFEIEAELIQIGNQLANYDSLVDYSTINLTVNKTTEEEIILPKTNAPSVSIVEVTKNTIELQVYNRSVTPAVVYVDVLQNGEFIRQYENDLLGESTLKFSVEDLKSFKEYTFKVTAISAESRESDITTRQTTTEKTFFNKVTNTFVVSFQALVTVIEYAGLVIVAIAPIAIVVAVLFFPIRLLHRKYRTKYPKKIKAPKENKEDQDQKRL